MIAVQRVSTLSMVLHISGQSAVQDAYTALLVAWSLLASKKVLELRPVQKVSTLFWMQDPSRSVPSCPLPLLKGLFMLVMQCVVIHCGGQNK